MACHARFVPRRSPALDRDLGPVAQLAREVFDVGAGTAVDLGRIFTGEECDVWTSDVQAAPMTSDTTFSAC
jgi:hypothetical protein